LGLDGPAEPDGLLDITFESGPNDQIDVVTYLRIDPERVPLIDAG